MNKQVKNSKETKEGISLIKQFEDLLEGTNRKIINIVVKQGELLERFNDRDDFFDSVGLSWSNIYFKIDLYNFLCKYPKVFDLDKSLRITEKSLHWRKVYALDKRLRTI